MQNELKLGQDRSKGAVSALYLAPADAWAVYMFAHGAGANMRHHFMQDTAESLAEQGIATLRFNFPYLEQGRSGPDPQPVLEAYVRCGLDKARELAPQLPLFAGGKSMGGRMTSNAVAKEPYPDLRGIIFFGFPLHAPNRPGRGREAHLFDVTVPMLFLQGTRDDLAELSLMKTVCSEVGERATLHIVEDGNHSFDVRKKSGRDAAMVRAELATTAAEWMRSKL